MAEGYFALGGEHWRPELLRICPSRCSFHLTMELIKNFFLEHQEPFY